MQKSFIEATFDQRVDCLHGQLILIQMEVLKGIFRKKATSFAAQGPLVFKGVFCYNG